MNSQPDPLIQRYGLLAPYSEHCLGDLILYQDSVGDITQGCIFYISVTIDQPHTPHYLVIPNIAPYNIIDLVFPHDIIHDPYDPNEQD